MIEESEIEMELIEFPDWFNESGIAYREYFGQENLMIKSYQTNPLEATYSNRNISVFSYFGLN